MQDTNSYKLLGILQSYAPTAKEQEYCSRYFNNMNDEKENVKVRMLAGSIFDGLAYGNWPWVTMR